MLVLQGSGRGWKDPTNHDVRVISVDEGVRLELLDRGGTGRPVVLLTGSGHTAHVYDDFAPKLPDLVPREMHAFIAQLPPAK